MPRLLFALIFAALAAPAMSQETKEESCRYQGLVMAAVQKARLDRVSKAKAESTILASNPPWPAQYSKAIAPLVDQIYSMKRRDLKNTDFGPVLEQQCLLNWDQIQQMKKNVQTN